MMSAAGNSRDNDIASRFRDGLSFRKIGAQFGLTGEGVRQILKKRGIAAEDGGQCRAMKDKADRLAAAKDARFLKRHGCNWSQYCKIRDYRHNPLSAFSIQKRNAKSRGIEWQLTLWQWWSIWKNSGHWDHRGRGQGYVMCRHGDVGPYSADNVFIDLGIKNSSERPQKVSGLPIGVQERGNRYLAMRMIDGVRYRLGSYENPDLAHAAYVYCGIQHAAEAPTHHAGGG